MKNPVLILAALTSVSSFANDSNYVAEKLKAGTEIEVKSDIPLSDFTYGVFIQKGEVVNGRVKVSRPYCSLSLLQASASAPIGLFAGEKFEVDYMLDKDLSRGSTGWVLTSSTKDRVFHLQCQKGGTIITRMGDLLGISHVVYMENMFKVRMNTIKKTLHGILEIKD